MLFKIGVFMRLWMILSVVSLYLFACKTVSSEESGVVSDSEMNSGLYYFKIYEGGDLGMIISEHWQKFSPTDEYTAMLKGCIICRFTCNAKNAVDINKDNVVKICNKDPVYIPCSDIGFKDNTSSVAYTELKEDLKSNDVVIKKVGEKSLYDYFEERMDLYGNYYTSYHNSSIAIDNPDRVGAARYLCPIGGGSMATIYSTAWEEVVEDLIYKLIDPSTNNERAKYYHVTDGKNYSIENENLVELCRDLEKTENSKYINMEDRKSSFYPISSEDFDFANKKKMAVSLQRRMRLGVNQCFITSVKTGNQKSYVLKSFSGRDCSKETSGRLICVAQ